MNLGVLVVVAIVSLITLPWPVTALVTFVAGIREPLIPVSIGLLSDILYYSPSACMMPYGTLAGLVATLCIVFVRRRLRTSTL